ncbi:MAG: FAD:protein FMN transferase [Ancalomicrobiaceae bacterium]|nr:FAD:protein FMN transferase [Ancalomicrobiaceae bacterium]
MAVRRTIVSFAAMGTDCSIELVGEPALVSAASDAAIAEVERIEARYSRYRPDSFLSEINRVGALGGTIAVDDETAFFLDAAFAAWVNSEGAFDITAGVLNRAWKSFDGDLPQQADIDRLLPLVGLEKLEWRRPVLRFAVAGLEIDFGGLAKEYAADRAADICRRHGVAAGIVNLGGDVAVIGAVGGQGWRIGIRDPRPHVPGATGDAAMAYMELTSGGLATSGDYARCITVGDKRYGHILDPRSGWPVEGLSSVTVAAESCMLAGLQATIAMLKGRIGAEWLTGRSKTFLVLDAEGAILAQCGMLS